MAITPISDTLLARLQSVDTPTVCNAIEVVEGKRGFDRYTRGTVIATDTRPVVGYARTAQLSGIAPPTESPDIIKARRMDYYRYMSAGNLPRVAVVEDVDYPHCVAAYWGEINTNVHKALGVNGTLTNGVVRDLGDLAEDYPVIAGSIGPSHAFVHIKAIACPVSVFGLGIQPDDLVHADRHGALVIPADYIAELDRAIDKLLASERIILDRAKGKSMSFEDFESAWAAFEQARI